MLAILKSLKFFGYILVAINVLLIVVSHIVLFLCSMNLSDCFEKIRAFYNPYDLVNFMVSVISILLGLYFVYFVNRVELKNKRVLR